MLGKIQRKGNLCALLKGWQACGPQRGRQALEGRCGRGSWRGQNQVREGLEEHTRESELCLLGHGEPSKIFEQRRAKVIICFREISDEQEKLSGMEASIFSLQKGNKHSENSVILQKLSNFLVFVTFFLLLFLAVITHKTPNQKETMELPPSLFEGAEPQGSDWKGQAGQGGPKLRGRGQARGRGRKEAVWLL